MNPTCCGVTQQHLHIHLSRASADTGLLSRSNTVNTAHDTTRTSQITISDKMGLLEDARRLAETYGPEVARHVASTADKAWKHGSAFGQEVAKRAGPATADAKTHLDKLSKEAGKHAAPIASSASKHAIILARAAYNSGKEGLQALPQVPGAYINEEYD